jgi:hypothetical protein
MFAFAFGEGRCGKERPAEEVPEDGSSIAGWRPGRNHPLGRSALALTLSQRLSKSVASFDETAVPRSTHVAVMASAGSDVRSLSKKVG